MADQPKKPRKIKDLKARLGRTISPGQQQQQGQGGAAVPPPAVGGGGAPGQAGGSGVPAPNIPAPKPAGGGGGGGGIPAPSIPGASGGGGGAGGAVPAPPFGQPEPQKPAGPSDPFAAQASPQQNEKRGTMFIVGGVALALGLVVGYGAGSMMSDRNLYNLAVRDGKEIYDTVREASDTVTKAQTYVDAAVSAARGGPGKQSEVDYQAIEALRALQKPLEAGAFARRRYNAFKPDTVDALFEYYNNINQLWSKFETLAARTLPDARREALDASAAATQNVATPTGCVPMMVEERFMCGLVYLRIPEEQEDPENPVAMVRTRLQGAQEYEKTLYTGQDLNEDTDTYVMLVHPERSVGVLGQQANEFAEYNALISEIKQLMDRTIEVQGRLERNLGDIARLEEVFTI